MKRVLVLQPSEQKTTSIPWKLGSLKAVRRAEFSSFFFTVKSPAKNRLFLRLQRIKPMKVTRINLARETRSSIRHRLVTLFLVFYFGSTQFHKSCNMIPQNPPQKYPHYRDGSRKEKQVAWFFFTKNIGRKTPCCFRQNVVTNFTSIATPQWTSLLCPTKW